MPVQIAQHFQSRLLLALGKHCGVLRDLRQDILPRREVGVAGTDWEHGVKKPGGPALRLLAVIQKKWLMAIA